MVKTETVNKIDAGLALNFLSVFLNAAAMTISKFALKNVNPILVTWIICLVSALLCLAYKGFNKVTFKNVELKRIVPIAFLNAVAMICLYASIALLDPVVVGLIGRFYVVFTTLLSVVILKEFIDRTEGVLIGAAILGTFLFVQKGQDFPLMHYLGVGLGLAYTLLFALANLLVKKNVHKTNSVTILFYNNLLAALACSALLLAQGAWSSSWLMVNAMTLYYAIAAAGLTFFGLVLFFNSFRFLSFRLSNIIRSSSPIFVALISWPFFPVQMSYGNVVGGTLVMMSIGMLVLREKKRK